MTQINKFVLPVVTITLAALALWSEFRPRPANQARTPQPQHSSETVPVDPELIPEYWLQHADTAPTFRRFMAALESYPGPELPEIARLISSHRVQIDLVDMGSDGAHAASFTLFPPGNPGARPTFQITRTFANTTEAVMQRIMRHEYEHYRQWLTGTIPNADFDGSAPIDAAFIPVKLHGEVDASVPECEFVRRSGAFLMEDTIHHDPCRAYFAGGKRGLARELAALYTKDPRYAAFRTQIDALVEHDDW